LFLIIVRSLILELPVPGSQWDSNRYWWPAHTLHRSRFARIIEPGLVCLCRTERDCNPR